MSDHGRASGGGKVTILSSGEPAQSSLEGNGGGGASSAATVSKSAANSRTSRRKVGTNLERSFVDPGAGPSRPPQQQVQQQQPRQVLKPGKPVASAPTPMQQRPMTDLEKAFSEKTVQDQRWLLSFPLALKQLYFGFAESTNHEQTLLTLINRFPELLAGNETHPSPILLAIRKGNWIPAMHFIQACVKGQQTRQLTQRSSPVERRTFLIEAVLRVGHEVVADAASDMSLAIKVILSLSEACPELLSAADCNGRNPLHYCAEQSKLYSPLLLPLLAELRQLALNSQNLARRLGNALATGDMAGGKKPIDLLIMTSEEATAAHGAMQNLMTELPVGVDEESEHDESMPQAPLLLLSGAAAKDAICSALAQRKKSAEFVDLLASSLSSVDPRAFLLSTVEQPEKVALEWFGSTQSGVVKQALTDVGLAEFCDLVDRL